MAGPTICMHGINTSRQVLTVLLLPLAYLVMHDGPLLVSVTSPQAAHALTPCLGVHAAVRGRHSHSLGALHSGNRVAWHLLPLLAPWQAWLHA